MGVLVMDHVNVDRFEGCLYGSLLLGVLRRYRHMHGILFDLGHVVGRARSKLQELGLEQRSAVIEGNFFESIPPGANAYLMRHIRSRLDGRAICASLVSLPQGDSDRGRYCLVEFTVPAAN
jgi:hypothetical protein